jgi:acetyltransferase
MGDNAQYPKHFEKVLRLKDGTEVLVRPIKREDVDKLFQMYTALSKETNHDRFFSRTLITREKVEEWVDVNYRDAMALVAIVGEDGDEKIIADARFYLDKETGEAEGAIVIIDMWQEKGIGTKILEHGVEVARKMGIKKLNADISPENRRILHVIKKLGFKVTWTPETGSYRINLPLE